MNLDPWASRVCRWAAYALAVWTVACNVVVLAGGTLHQLLVLIAVASVVAGLVWWRQRRKSSPLLPPPMDTAGASAQGWRASVLYGVLALGAVGALARGELVLTWCLCMVVLATALVVEARTPASFETPVSTRRLETGLWILGVLGALLALVAIRPSGDDALIVNLAVTAADHPDQPLLRNDGIFGIEGMPIQFPFYRVHSIEVLAGAISLLTGIAAIHVMHLVMPMIAGLFVMLAHAELFRRILPGLWLPATLATSVAYITMGNDWPSYGFSSFVLLQIPRSICFCVALPLVVAYGLDFSRYPTRRNWILLASIQIAAVGLTSTAMFVAPLVAWVTLAVTHRRTSMALLCGMSASAWVVVVLLAWLGDMRRAVAGMEHPAGLTMVLPDNVAAMGMMLERVLGTGAVALVTLFTVLFAFTVPRAGMTRRLLIVFPLVWMFAFANPLWARWLSTELMDPVIFRRAAWILPVPAMMAVTFLAPARWLGARWGSMLGLALIVGYGTLVPSRAGTELGLSATKTPDEAYRAARLVVENAPPGFQALAPSDVATWISTFHDHPSLFTSRAFYNRFLVAELGAAAAERRVAVTRRFAEQAPDVGDAEELRHELRHDRIGAICYRGRDEPPKPPLRQMMLSCGYRYAGRVGVFHCWVLRDPVAARWQ